MHIFTYWPTKMIDWWNRKSGKTKTFLIHPTDMMPQIWYLSGMMNRYNATCENSVRVIGNHCWAPRHQYTDVMPNSFKCVILANILEIPAYCEKKKFILLVPKIWKKSLCIASNDMTVPSFCSFKRCSVDWFTLSNKNVDVQYSRNDSVNKKMN